MRAFEGTGETEEKEAIEVHRPAHIEQQHEPGRRAATLTKDQFNGLAAMADATTRGAGMSMRKAPPAVSRRRVSLRKRMANPRMSSSRARISCG